LYGSPSDDSADEVRFSVELTKLAGLSGTYSLDIRRLKGNLRSYKFIYDTIRELVAIRLRKQTNTDSFLKKSRVESLIALTETQIMYG
jgi:hypothetical protein